MNGLKTLKEITVPTKTEDISTLESFTWRLRQEAIKWIRWRLEKSGLKIIKIKGDHISWKGEKDLYQAGAIHQLVTFFNIMEEDLITNKELNAREHGETGDN